MVTADGSVLAEPKEERKIPFPAWWLFVIVYFHFPHNGFVYKSLSVFVCILVVCLGLGLRLCKHHQRPLLTDSLPGQFRLDKYVGNIKTTHTTYAIMIAYHHPTTNQQSLIIIVRADWLSLHSAQSQLEIHYHFKFHDCVRALCNVHCALPAQSRDAVVDFSFQSNQSDKCKLHNIWILR